MQNTALFLESTMSILSNTHSLQFNFNPTNITFSELAYVYEHAIHLLMSRVCMHEIQQTQIE